MFVATCTQVPWFLCKFLAGAQVRWTHEWEPTGLGMAQGALTLDYRVEGNPNQGGLQGNACV